MEKIERLLKELKEEIYNRFEVTPNINISIHGTSHEKRFKIIEASQAMERLRKDSRLDLKYSLNIFDSHHPTGSEEKYLQMKLENGYNEPIRLDCTLYFFPKTDTGKKKV